MEKKKLNEEELEKIAGGDYGTSYIDYETADAVQFKYQIGEQVEVYKSFFHWSTSHAVVLDRFATSFEIMDAKWGAAYKVQYDDGTTDDMVYEDDIQDKK